MAEEETAAVQGEQAIEQQASISQIADETHEEPKLSKNAAKKLARQRAYEAEKPFKRAREKERKKAKLMEKRKLVEEGVLDKSELERKTKRKRPAGKIEPFDAIVVCDLAFDHLMIHKETKSMASQVSYCYSANRSTNHPVKLLCTSFNGKLKERMDTVMAAQYKSWKGVQFWPDTYEKLWRSPDESNPSDDGAKEWTCPKENVVYLTGDSPNILESLEEGKTYILGGIVDRNRYKYLCLDKAKKEGLSHAALPIAQHMPELTSRKVLTVNQVFEIMIRWIETKDWGDAIRTVMPTRKLHNARATDQDAGESADAKDSDAESEPVPSSDAAPVEKSVQSEAD